MKKFISFTLAVMMIATMSVTAFAAETSPMENKTEGSYSITVNGTYTPAQGGAEKVSVTVAWENMEFTYDAGSEGTWNEKTHSYDNTVAAKWSDEKGTITVTNHSNVAVTATLAWKQNESITGTITGTFSGSDVENNVLTLESADQEKYRIENADGTYPAPTKTAQFGISGDGIEKTENNLGTITVTIAKKAVSE